MGLVSTINILKKVILPTFLANNILFTKNIILASNDPSKDGCAALKSNPKDQKWPMFPRFPED